MTFHQITHIRKPNTNSTNEHITHVKYDGVIYTRESVIRLIESKTDAFYVMQGGNRSEVGVVRPDYPRLPFLRTHADSKWNDNLLSLPQC